MVYDRMDDRPAFVGIPTFLHLPALADAEALQQEHPDAVIVGAPTDTAVTHRPGARFGPRAIRAASNLRRGSYHLGLGVQPFKLLRVFDYGDADVVPGDIERTNQAVRAKVGEVAKAGARPIVLGGDHSVTYPSVSAVAEALGRGRLGVVHFDAHADTANDSWGVLLSHGTPMRRLIESGAVPGRAFVQVGLRGYWPPPSVFDWMREQGMRWHTIHDIQRRGFEAVLTEAIEQALDGPDRIYLSVDIDVLDPAYAPGTGTPEPGGLTARELLQAVREVTLRTELAGADVVEVSPPYDAAGITAEVAHRVVMEILSALAAKRAEGGA
ncbi:MAG: agmatinase [Chloroflexi bacterium RBG_16_68_14]|nr:MAG: agmatinase [Chloroflexi bacterium RBG_16_68_14]